MKIKKILTVALCFCMSVPATSMAQRENLPGYVKSFEKGHKVLLPGKKVSELLVDLKPYLAIEQMLYSAPTITRFLDYKMPRATFKGNSLSFYVQGRVHVLQFPANIDDGLRLDGQLIKSATLKNFGKTVDQIERILNEKKTASHPLSDLFLPKAHALTTGTGLAIGLGLLAVAIGYFAYTGLKVKVAGKTKHDVDVAGGTNHNVRTDHSLDIGDNITGVITGNN